MKPDSKQIIQINESYNIEITGMNHEGQGVGRMEGFTVFVDGGLPGEIVEAKVEQYKKTYAVAKLIRVVRASPHRIDPFCPVFESCGGCSLQHMSYEAQLEFKTGQVRDALERIGKLEGVLVHPTIGMEEPLHYRNKAMFPVGWRGKSPVLGFYSNRSHDIIDSNSCEIQSEISDKVRGIVREFIISNRIRVYDEKTHTGILRHIMVRTGSRTGEAMVVLVINDVADGSGKGLGSGQESEHGWEKLVNQLSYEVSGLKSIVLNYNSRRGNIILGDRNRVIFGEGFITDYIGEYKFNISPQSFYQVNPTQTEVLYGKALEYAGLTGNETVFDLYCGIGTITLFLSQRAGKVYGVEVVEGAVADARRNASINGIENVEFITGEAEKIIPKIYSQGIRADVVVVDPPRKGCDEELLQTLVKMEAKRIVYVSCNPSTLARDLHFLTGNGYEVREVQPVDMFGWTAHVETVVLMSRVEK